MAHLKRAVTVAACAFFVGSAAAQVTADRFLEAAAQLDTTLGQLEQSMAQRPAPWPERVTAVLGEAKERLLVSWAMCLDLSAADVARSRTPPAESVAAVALERCRPILRTYRRVLSARARGEGRALGEAQLDEAVRTDTMPMQARLITTARQLLAPPVSGPVPGPPLPGPPQPHNRGPRPARAQLATPVAELITPRDYPAAAARAGVEGVVRVRLEVSRRGRVTGCTIVEASGSEALDSTTCQLFRTRARFTPARDVRGRAMADVLVQAVRWTLAN